MRLRVVFALVHILTYALCSGRAGSLPVTVLKEVPLLFYVAVHFCSSPRTYSSSSI